MHKTEFVALPVPRLRPCVVVAERNGWSASFVDEGLLRTHGVDGRLVRLAHPDAPFPLILYRRSDADPFTVVKRGWRAGPFWREVLRDPGVASEVIDDAPVAAPAKP